MKILMNFFVCEIRVCIYVWNQIIYKFFCLGNQSMVLLHVVIIFFSLNLLVFLPIVTMRHCSWITWNSDSEWKWWWIRWVGERKAEVATGWGAGSGSNDKEKKKKDVGVEKGKHHMESKVECGQESENVDLKSWWTRHYMCHMYGIGTNYRYVIMYE